MSAALDAPASLDLARVTAFLGRAADVGRPRPAPGRIDETLASLAGLGLAPGSAVIIALSSSVRTVRVHLAALLLGLVPVAVPPGMPGERVRRLAVVTGAGALVTARPDPRRYGPTTRPVDGAEAVMLGEAAAEPRFRPGQVLISTSGTSGASSVCLHRVESLLRNGLRHARAVGMTAADTVLVSLPLYYSYGMVAQVLAALQAGAGIVVTGPPFTPRGYARAIADYGVTHGSLTPELVRRMLAERASLAEAPRVLTVGGDRLDPAHVAPLLRARPGGELYLTYGLTEAGPRVSTLAAHAEPASRHASVGLPLPGVRAWVRDADPADGTGELMVESDTVMIGKLGAATPGRGLAGPGQVATGDRFRVDKDGYLYFEGRISDFALIRGEKVSLSGLRQAACAIDGVVRCAPRLRTTPGGETELDLEVAVVRPGPGTPQRIRRALNSVLMPAERPREIIVTAATDQEFHK